MAVVVPQPGSDQGAAGLSVWPRDDLAWATFVNTWIELKRRDGSLDGLYSHWILGKARRAASTPRWSVIRNVLHWVE